MKFIVGKKYHIKLQWREEVIGLATYVTRYILGLTIDGDSSQTLIEIEDIEKWREVGSDQYHYNQQP